MNFSTLYRVSVYLMLVFASLVLSVDTTDNRYAMLYPVGVGVAALAAFLTVDRRESTAVSDALLNVLALASAGLSVVEYQVDPNLLLLALGHWLIYLEVVLMFRRKSPLEDWELFLLGLVQVLVGTVISQSDSVGLMLFAWAVLALWVLGLLSLKREAVRAQAKPAAAGASADALYPDLLDGAFLMSAVRVTLTTLALGGVIFLAMPRRSSMARSRTGDVTAQHLTGFEDEVKLGRMGEILENDSVVMTIEMFDENGARLVPRGESLWRGVTMAEYEKGLWRRQEREVSTFPILYPGWPGRMDPTRERPRGVIRQQIKLEANDSNVLFGLRPMFDASTGRRYGPDLSSVDGTISRPDSRTGTIDYEVRSLRDTDLPQPGESPPDRDRPMMRMLLGVPSDARPPLRAIAEAVIRERVAPSLREDPRARAEALEAYLRDSGLFGYTLKLDVVDPNLDPVVDFLVNRKEGHCEYFASALTLLLRTVGIPARMVNGFKGGDYNDLARVMNVRQKHAHSWVEAYLGRMPGAERSPRWLTLDPTPGNERDASVARVGGFSSNFRQITDAIRYVWVFYVVGYNADRQNTLLYEPIRNLLRQASKGFAIMGEGYQGIRTRLVALLQFRDVRSFISVRGFCVSFAALLLLAGLARGASWLARRLIRWYRSRLDRSGALSAGAAHYRRLTLLLGGYGLERPPAETQDEFARRATVFLTARGSNTEAVADVPRLVVDAFYRVRFGHLDLNPQAAEQLESRLDALEASLTASHD